MGPSRVKRRLADLIEIKHGHAFRGEYFRDGPPGDVLLTPGNFAIGGGFKADKLKFYRGPVDPEFVLGAGTLLITMTDLSKAGDTLGYPARVPRATGSARYLHNQRLGRVAITRPDELDEGFLYYVLCSPAYRHEVVASATGSTVKHTSPKRIGEVEVCLPPLQEQRRIAWVLSAVDRKIEANDALAGSLAATAELAYAHVTREAGSGLSLAELAEQRRGTVVPSERASTLFEHFSIPALDAGKGPEVVPGSQLKSGKTPVADDCVLISKLNPRWHRVWWPRPSGEGEPVCSPEFVMLIPRAGTPLQYLHAVLRFDRGLRQHLLAHATGTTGSRQRIKPADLLDAPITVPPPQSLDELASTLTPMFELEGHILDENKTLSKIRDTLLPQLISGQVRVPEDAVPAELDGAVANGQTEAAEIAGTAS